MSASGGEAQHGPADPEDGAFVADGDVAPDELDHQMPVAPEVARPPRRSEGRGAADRRPGGAAGIRALKSNCCEVGGHLDRRRIPARWTTPGIPNPSSRKLEVRLAEALASATSPAGSGSGPSRRPERAEQELADAQTDLAAVRSRLAERLAYVRNLHASSDGSFSRPFAASSGAAGDEERAPEAAYWERGRALETAYQRLQSRLVSSPRRCSEFLDLSRRTRRPAARPLRNGVSRRGGGRLSSRSGGRGAGSPETLDATAPPVRD